MTAIDGVPRDGPRNDRVVGLNRFGRLSDVGLEETSRIGGSGRYSNFIPCFSGCWSFKGQAASVKLHVGLRNQSFLNKHIKQR